MTGKPEPAWYQRAAEIAAEAGAQPQGTGSLNLSHDQAIVVLELADAIQASGKLWPDGTEALVLEIAAAYPDLVALFCDDFPWPHIKIGDDE